MSATRTTSVTRTRCCSSPRLFRCLHFWRLHPRTAWPLPPPPKVIVDLNFVFLFVVLIGGGCDGWRVQHTCDVSRLSVCSAASTCDAGTQGRPALSPLCQWQCDVWIRILFFALNVGWVGRGQWQVRRACGIARQFPHVCSTTASCGAVVSAWGRDGWLGPMGDHGGPDVGVLLWAFRGGYKTKQESVQFIIFLMLCELNLLCVSAQSLKVYIQVPFTFFYCSIMPSEWRGRKLLCTLSVYFLLV